MGYDTVSDVEERAADLGERGNPARVPLEGHVQAEKQAPRLRRVRFGGHLRIGEQVGLDDAADVLANQENDAGQDSRDLEVAAHELQRWKRHRTQVIPTNSEPTAHELQSA